MRMNKLIRTISVALAVGFFFIGIHQSINLGVTYAYWLFMVSVMFLLLNRYLQKKAE